MLKNALLFAHEHRVRVRTGYDYEYKIGRGTGCVRVVMPPRAMACSGSGNDIAPRLPGRAKQAFKATDLRGAYQLEKPGTCLRCISQWHPACQAGCGKPAAENQSRVRGDEPKTSTRCAPLNVMLSGFDTQRTGIDSGRPGTKPLRLRWETNSAQMLTAISGTVCEPISMPSGA